MAKVPTRRSRGRFAMAQVSGLDYPPTKNAPVSLHFRAVTRAQKGDDVDLVAGGYGRLVARAWSYPRRRSKGPTSASQ